MNIVQDVGGNNNGGDGNNDQSQPQPPPQPPSQPPPPPPPRQRCPRCDSANTKFCYYNNYSLSQPRYFCKTCKRYWTQGGTLRNIPIGGGCRKGKRTKTTSFASSSSSISSAAATPQPLTEVTAALQAPRSLIGPAVGPMGPAYYQGGGYLSMIHSQNQLSQPFFNFSSSMNNFAPSSISSSSNLGLIHHAWLNASSSTRSNILPPPPPVATIFQSDESVYVSGDHNQQGGVVETSVDVNMNMNMNMNMSMNMMMGNTGGYGAASLDWSQNNNSLWSTVSTTSIGGVNNNSGGHIHNGDQSNDIVDVNGDDKAGGSSSSLSGNPWSHLP